ncbi:cytochrome C oxidase assembly protein [Devosia sp. Root413D1]|uniref:cytochrome c oxidase assembly protein n=1 Tax=unclassified Devosia TaxID=196773 RepID=UPI0006F6291F|nr:MULTISPECIES: cytochrome c oxidase assembly protein [unclassified Devosia]KQU94036.1 cytochrome C oxidase assembly protein [Devosia sp. Root105]KQW80142.1 cytochrome C oxidase assembly protein [Devosia sp. Root413D1]
MTDASLPQSPPNSPRNRRVAITLLVLVAAMVGAAYAAVPLYALFCQVTGFGGTTQVSAGNLKGAIAREMTVRFDSNVEGALPWTVTAAKPVTDKIGNVETVVFTAHNLSDKPVTGQAIFNVTPEQTGMYFNKIECFCFTEQTLQPGETVEMPIVFFVDPDIAENRDLDTIRDITLSYTFYAVKSEGT